MDPNDSKASESSLWELELLAKHYNPMVSGMVRIFEDSLSKPSYDLEDFLDQSYFSLIETELKSKSSQKLEPTISISGNEQSFGSWVF
jgi:U3 small nucleolar RNA-associated protein 19